MADQKIKRTGQMVTHAPALSTCRPSENVEKRVIGALFPQILKELRKNEAFLCAPSSVITTVDESGDSPVIRQVARLRGHHTQLSMRVRSEDNAVSECEIEYVFQIVIHQKCASG